MKRWFCCLLSLALCLSLWGCSIFPFGDPIPETTEPTESVTETTTPTETEPIPETEPSTEPSTVTEAPEEELSWAEVYGLLLRNLKTMNSEYYGEYCLYDIDGDNSPEMFVKLGTCEADFEISVYTMTEAGAELIDTLSGSHTSICGLSGENACLLVTGHQGYEQISQLTLVKGQLQQESIYEASGEEYHDFSFLRTYQLDQAEGLNWNGNPADSNRAVLDNYKGRFPYLLRIPYADQSVFSGPNYDSSFVQTVEVAGTYTIMEERWDEEGNLWGRLKSGAGWIDLTDLQNRIDFYVPISVNYADKTVLQNPNQLYACLDNSNYGFSVAFRAYETLTDVCIYVANMAMDNPWEQEVYYVEQLTPEQPLVADIAFPGDMSAYTIAFTDSKGVFHAYILTSSGRNNALVFYEY